MLHSKEVQSRSEKVKMGKKCKICKSESKFAFKARILSKYNIDYFLCDNCAFMQTEKPFWLSEVYECSMNLSDCGILVRNIYFSRLLTPLLFYSFDKDAKYLDYAGGYGVFTRLMRDIGFDFLWCDPHTTNLFAQGFEFRKDTDRIELLTAFETFEHFEDPLVEIKKMLMLSDSIAFSTLLLPQPIPHPDEWWYYGLEHGQHIALYTLTTLQFIAKNLGMRLYSNNVDFHIFTNKRINPLFFKHLPKLSKYGLFFGVRSLMKSRTVNDMNFIIAMQKISRS